MIGFKNYLTEARMAPLYHSTTVRSIDEILSTNMLKRGWQGDMHPSKDGMIVSLTRNLNFAFNWQRISGVVIELDQLKISQRYKITPYNFFSGHTETFGKKAVAGWGEQKTNPARKMPEDSDLTGPKSFTFENQFEESVHQDIKNLDKLITKIIVRDFEKFKSVMEDYSPLLMDHPLLYDYKTKRFVNQG